MTNLNNVSIDTSGRVVFSGISSGIDFKSAVDSIIKARSVPVDRLTTQISGNDKKTAAYQDFRSKLTTLQSSLSTLYGAVSVDNAKNIFEAKQAYASAARSDGGAASSPGSVLSAAVTNQAQAATHTLEVVQTAASHKIASGVFTSKTTDIGTASGQGAGSIAGTINVGGATVQVQATDNLQDVADRINAANTGTTPSGVSASIVQASANEFYMVLSVDKTGQTLGSDVALSDTGNVLKQLGVKTAGGGFANELQAAKKAQFYADGLLDNAKYSSVAQASSTAPLGSAGSIDFKDASGTVVDTIAYGAGDTMDDLRARIAGSTALQAAGIGASVATSGAGKSLKITGSAAFTMSDSGSALGSLGVAKDKLLLQRDSNTISDLYKGTTISLYKAEPGTTVTLDVEPDLSQAKTAIQNVVIAYNAVRQALNTQLDVDPGTGKARTDSVLFGDSTLTSIESQLNNILGAGKTGNAGQFQALAQIGITFVDNSSVSDPTLDNTIQLDSSKLDAILLSNPADVEKLFTFSATSSDPRVAVIGFDGRTGTSATGYQVDFAYDAMTQSLTGATLSDGTASVNGTTATVDTGGATGLKLFYTGTTNATGVQIDITQGVGAKLFFALGGMLDSTTGSIQSQLDGLTSQNKLAQSRIDDMNGRLERQRTDLTNRFVAMEAQLAQLDSVKTSITQITDSLNAKNN